MSLLSTTTQRNQTIGLPLEEGDDDDEDQHFAQCGGGTSFEERVKDAD
jgi:hypothetical protein